MNKNLRKIIRIATKEDKKHNEENLKMKKKLLIFAIKK